MRTGKDRVEVRSDHVPVAIGQARVAPGTCCGATPTALSPSRARTLRAKRLRSARAITERETAILADALSGITLADAPRAATATTCCSARKRADLTAGLSRARFRRARGSAPRRRARRVPCARMPAMLPSRMLGTATLIDASGAPVATAERDRDRGDPVRALLPVQRVPLPPDLSRAPPSARGGWMIEAGIGAGSSSPG